MRGFRMVASAPMAELPEFAGCEVLRKLHSGSVYDLYHAIQEPLGRPVFVKALGSSILPSSPFASTLEREARLLAELDHPNLIKVFDFVRRDERMWLVLEYVDGFSLDEIQKKLGRLPVTAALSIASAVARGLEHAHAHGIVHREIQPRNVLVSRRGQVKLANFMVAVDERMPTAPELLDGTTSYGGPIYMSPEQILGEPADPRTDLFSLGVVLYELLSGQRPFEGPDERSTSLRIRRDPPVPLTRHVPDLPPSVERIVQRCLEKMPSDRQANAAELADALDAARAELGALSVEAEIRRALLDGGLVTRDASEEKDAPRPAVLRPWTLRRTTVGLLVLFGAIVASGTAIQVFAGERDPAPRRSSGRLEVSPQNRAYLRVVAHPWAHVIVDGQHVDTTPFARPIPLSAGTHYVRLEHPNAPTERRTINLSPGETLLLDVNLKIQRPVAPADGVTRPLLDSGILDGPSAPTPAASQLADDGP